MKPVMLWDSGIPIRDQTEKSISVSTGGMFWKKPLLPLCLSEACYKHSESDKFVSQFIEDIIPKPNFLKVSNRRLPYDYGSLMHYHAVAHAVKVSDFTIVPKELKYVTTMGTEKMAFLDAKVINDIYCPSIDFLSRTVLLCFFRYLQWCSESPLSSWRISGSQ